MTMKASVYIKTEHFLFDYAVKEIERAFKILHIFHDQPSYCVDQDLINAKADVVISFLNETIIRGVGLEKLNINFHPAPPWYPGRGGASVALYDRRRRHGATAHKMQQKVDSGEIYFTQYFDVGPNETCETLHTKGILASFELLVQFVNHILRHGQFPPPSTEQWEGNAMSKKAFLEWMTLENLDDLPHIENMIRATKHSFLPGPFVKVQGHTFSLLQKKH